MSSINFRILTKSFFFFPLNAFNMSVHLPKHLDFSVFTRGETPVLVKSNSQVLVEPHLGCSVTLYLDDNCLHYEAIKKIIKDFIDSILISLLVCNIVPEMLKSNLLY